MVKTYIYYDIETWIYYNIAKQHIVLLMLYIDGFI